MSMSRTLFIASLLLNVCLLVVVARAYWRVPADVPVLSAPEQESHDTIGMENQSAGWEAVASEDYLAYAENLREKGLPEHLVQQIIIAEVDRPFESQLKEIAAPREESDYWATDGSYEAIRALDAEQVLAIQALRRARELLLRSVLGPDAQLPVILPDVADPYLVSLGFLPEDKKLRVFALEELYTARTLNPVESYVETYAENAIYREAVEEKEQAITDILSAEEREEFDLRMSGLAREMRENLRGLDLTEYEFREIFRVHRDFSAQRGDQEPSFVGFYEVRPESPTGRVFHERLREILADGRYEQVQDHRYMAIVQTLERRGLDASMARIVYLEHRNARLRLDELSAEAGLTSEHHEQMVQAIANEFEASLRGIVGAEEYQRWGRGWVTQIEREGQLARKSLR